MKNRLLWLLILSVFVIIGLFYIVSLDKKTEKNTENQTQNKEKNKVILKKIKAEKEIELKKVEETTKEKITRLKEENKYYKIITLWENKFYFQVSWKRLELFLNKKSIWFFDVFFKNMINIKQIYSNENKFLIEIWNKKYIYNKINWSLENFILKIPILYAKETDINYIIKTTKWIFLFSKGKIEYSQIFSDFIYYNNWYLWILNLDDKNRRKNLGFEKNTKNLIIYYNPLSKEKKKIFEADFQISKIYKNWNKIFVENKKWDKYKVIF